MPTPAGTLSAADVRVAYFSMEIALDPRLPTYSGGLGVLAGDFLCSASDLRLPLVAVTLAYRNGYFRQQIDAAGCQVETPIVWQPADLLERLEPRAEVEIAGRPVVVAAWRLLLTGVTGGTVPVVFLDTDLAENDPEDRAITDELYGGDREHRLRQEAVLGIAGVSMLRALGYGELATFHMNEGHASLLTLQLLDAEIGAATTATTPQQVAEVRSHCVFTTHTPVAAGHDRFDAGLVRTVLGDRRTTLLGHLGLLSGDELNMTSLGAALSCRVNAVSRRHGEVTKTMLPEVEVSSITNGVHHVHWASAPIRSLLDEHVPGWRIDSSMLRYASDLPLERLRAAHASSKQALLEIVKQRDDVELDASALTIGLARRVTPYKRTLLVFSDPARLEAIAKRHGPIQIVCSGKAHPHDDAGKGTIASLVALSQRFGKAVKVVFLPDYDLELAAALCAGCDLWLNTPQRPLEASGTSGMKAAVNGVPSLSILDGWWLEGWVEGVTGWAIGDDASGDARYAATDSATEEGGEAATEEASGDSGDADAGALYDKLDGAVAPCFFGEPEAYLRVRRSALALNGSFFSTDRMAREYAREIYGLAPQI